MKLIYIAAKFSAPTREGVEANIRAAVELGLEVARIGACPVIPHANTAHPEFEHIQPYAFWIEATMALLLRCDAILMHPNWRESSGAHGEHDAAEKRGMAVFYSVDELRDWLEGVT